jgi:putative hydrolase of the HAD superfamily
MPTHIYKAALFDLDNTLADRNLALVTTAHALHAWRPEISADMDGDEFVTQFLAMDNHGKAGRDLLMKRVLNRWTAIELDQAAMLEWFASVYALSFPHDPRVIEFLTSLNDASILWGIVTNGSVRQHETTQALGLEAICPCIIVSEEVGNRKPGPTIFTKALDCLGLGVSTDVIFVGDDAVTDIEGAHTLGLSTAWVRRQRPWTDPYYDPDHQIDHVAELAPLLGL